MARPEMPYSCIMFVDDNDKRACRIADLHRVAAARRHDETADHGCDQTNRRTHTAGDGECDGEREGYYAHNDTGDKVASEFCGGIILARRD